MNQEDEGKVLGCSHIPALPGYAVASLSFEDRKIELEPIIAWLLVTRQQERENEPRTTVAPVTLKGAQYSNVPVVYPDGTVRVTDGRLRVGYGIYFQTVESWKEDRVRWIEERSKR